MSDPLKGLKPTTGFAELGNENDAGGEVEIGGIAISTDRRARFAGEYVISRDEMNANLCLIADAFNAYTATGLAPSQLAKALADEKALTAELTSQRDELSSFARDYLGSEDPCLDGEGDRCGSCAVCVLVQTAKRALARAKGGAR